MKMLCPVCKKLLGKVPHYRNCNPQNLPKEDIKEWVFEFNFAPFIKQHGEEIKDMYLKEQRSVLELSTVFQISWNRMLKVLTTLGIEVRTLAQSATTTRARQKYQDTCMDKYGSNNALSKNTTAYHKRNQTVKDKYSVHNVFQTDAVKNKINNTMLSRYGVLRISKLPKFYKNVPNRLEARLSGALTRLDIGHKFSHYVKRRQFHFLITDTKILIEVQGDFRHANPTLYNGDDQIKFLSGIRTVQSIWDQDEMKKQIAESYGYTVIYLWEANINNCTDDALEKWLLTLLAAELHLPLPDLQP